jgi:hypothetical protein
MKKTVILSTLAICMTLSLFLSCSSSSDEDDTPKAGQWSDIALNAYPGDDHICFLDYEVTAPGYYIIECKNYPTNKNDITWSVSNPAHSLSGSGESLGDAGILQSGKYHVAISNQGISIFSTQARLVLVTESDIVLPNEGFPSPVSLTLDVLHHGKSGDRIEHGVFGYSYYSFVAPESGNYTLDIIRPAKTGVRCSYGTNADFTNLGSETIAYSYNYGELTTEMPIIDVTKGITYYIRIDANNDSKLYNTYDLKMVKD